MSVRILQGDCRSVLASLPGGSVQCCVTSPPYYGLRDYGVAGQIGLEQSPAEYVEQMVAVFREVRRVLRDDGTCWLNLGDSYANDGKWGGASGGKHVESLHGASGIGRQKQDTGLKPKDLIGIPWRVAFALQADGWWLRQDIIWSKPNPMPESVTDRCTKSHEYLFLLAKSERYFYDQDAIAEPISAASVVRLSEPNLQHQLGSDRVPGKTNGPMKAVMRRSGNRERKPASARGVPVDDGGKASGAVAGSVPWEGTTRNKRSVWTVTTQPYAEAHFATFPPELIEPCILAGTSDVGRCSQCGAPWVRETERTRSRDGEPLTGSFDTGGGHKIGASGVGHWRDRTEVRTLGWAPSCDHGDSVVPAVVLDPFGGSGTTALVADRLRRDAILIELNPEYVAMAERRLLGDGGLFMDIAAQ